MSFAKRLKQQQQRGAPMRVAICVSGQPRTWRKCLPFWNSLFRDQGLIQFDVFFHMWDFNTVSNYVGQAPRPIMIPIQERRDLVNILQPKKYMFEGSDIDPRKMIEEVDARDPHRPKSDPVAIWTCSQFYSLMMAAQLKRAYEVENDFEYDACVRARADLVFPEDQDKYVGEAPYPEARTVYTVHCSYDAKYMAYRAGDIFFYADSPTFDAVCQFYRFLPCLREDMFDGANCDPPLVPPEIPFHFFIKMLNLENHHLVGFDPKVRRDATYEKLLKALGKSLGGHEVV